MSAESVSGQIEWEWRVVILDLETSLLGHILHIQKHLQIYNLDM